MRIPSSLVLNLLVDNMIPDQANSLLTQALPTSLSSLWMFGKRVLLKENFWQQQSTVCKQRLTLYGVCEATFSWKMAYCRVSPRHPRADMLLSCLSSPHLCCVREGGLIGSRSSLFWSAGNSLANDELQLLCFQNAYGCLCFPEP